MKIIINRLQSFCSYSFVIIFTIFIQNSPYLFAQNSFYVPHNTLSVGAGTASYYGDLSPYSRPIQSTIDEIRWNIAANYIHSFGNHWSARVGLKYIRIAGDDANMLGVKGKEARFVRNLHFRNDVKELSLMMAYDFVNAPRYYTKRKLLSPYLLGGIIAFLHSPEAKTPDGTWVKLRPLNTEGQGLPNYDTPYKVWGMGAAVGAGIKIKLSPHLDLGLESSFHYAFTDYLDDVYGKYASNTDLTDPLAIAMANRAGEKAAAYSGIDRTEGIRSYVVLREPFYANPATDPFTSTSIRNFGRAGTSRGGSALKDGYLVTSINLIFHLPNKVVCPKY